MVNINKITKKSLEKKHVKYIKIFLKKKKKKRRRKTQDSYQNFSEEEKQKKVDYMRNDYSAHKKEFLSCFLGLYKLVGNIGYLNSKNILA